MFVKSLAKMMFRYAYVNFTKEMTKYIFGYVNRKKHKNLYQNIVIYVSV